MLQRQVILFCLGETLTDQPPIFSPTDLPVNNRATLAGFDGSVPKPGLEVNLGLSLPGNLNFFMLKSSQVQNCLNSFLHLLILRFAALLLQLMRSLVE